MGAVPTGLTLPIRKVYDLVATGSGSSNTAIFYLNGVRNFTSTWTSGTSSSSLDLGANTSGGFSNPNTVYFLLQVWSTRCLSASDVLDLYVNIWDFGVWPPDRVFIPGLIPAAGAAVTMDAPAVIEFLAGQRRGDTAFTEAGAGLYVDRSELIEFGAGHRSNGSAPGENLANAMRDHAEPAESPGPAARDPVGTTESPLGTRSEAVPGIEALFKALADGALVEEMLSAQLLDAMIAAEMLITLRMEAAALLEALVRVVRDGNIPDEMLRGATADIVTQIESQRTAPAVIGDSRFMLEWLATPQSDRPLVAEFLTPVRSGASVRDEFLTALREDVVPATEFKALLRAAGNLPIESLLTAAGNVISADAVLALELLGSRLRDVNFPIQWSALPAMVRVSLERLVGSPSKRRILGTPGRSRLLKRQ
jgi:hypothetical protein